MIISQIYWDGKDCGQIGYRMSDNDGKLPCLDEVKTTGLCLYMNDGTSLRNVRQIRQTEYPEYNLGNTRTSQINIYLALLVKHHKCF